MLDRGSWNRTQRRYGTPERRSVTANVLSLMVATMVIVAALAMLVVSGHGRRAMVTVAPATPTMGLGSPGRTIASASPPRAAVRMSPRRARALRGPRGARPQRGRSGPAPVSRTARPPHAAGRVSVPVSLVAGAASQPRRVASAARLTASVAAPAATEAVSGEPRVAGAPVVVSARSGSGRAVQFFRP
jgi:hypothetical protein